jgi:hypothetical protein
MAVRDEAMRPRIDVSPGAGIPLPPSPMSPARAEPAVEAPLRWSTGWVTAAVCLAVAGANWALLTVYGHVGMWWPLRVLGPAAYGLAAGIGMASMDRLARRWARPVRWALGVGLTVWVPDLVLAGFLGRLSMSGGLGALTALHSSAVGLALGAALGLAAGSESGRWWRMALAGVGIQVLAAGEAVAEHVLLLHFRWATPLPAAGPLPLSWGLGVLWAALFGLTVALCLDAASAKAARVGPGVGP